MNSQIRKNPEDILKSKFIEQVDDMGCVLFNKLDLFAESFMGGKEAGETVFFVGPRFPDLRVRLLFLFSQFLVALLVPFCFASDIDLGNWIGQVNGEVIVSPGVEEHL